MEYDTSELEPSERARIVKSAVTPRPIAWISTVDGAGTANLAPFSSYNYVSAEEPVVMFNTPNEAHGGLKDTARNVLSTEEFAVNVVTESLLEEMDHTSATVAPDVSEFDVAGVQRAECRQIEPPRVADAVVTMECTLFDSFEIRNRLMILGEVVYVHVDEVVTTDGRIDARNVDTVGRLGGTYYTISRPVEFKRRY